MDSRCAGRDRFRTDKFSNPLSDPLSATKQPGKFSGSDVSLADIDSFYLVAIFNVRTNVVAFLAGAAAAFRIGFVRKRRSQAGRIFFGASRLLLFQRQLGFINQQV
jgi:hypothetical protein